jgi:hypothetical protein
MLLDRDVLLIVAANDWTLPDIPTDLTFGAAPSASLARRPEPLESTFRCSR